LESFAVDSIAFLNRLNQTLDAVSDETSAKAALPKLDQAARDVAKLKETTQKMPKPSDEATQKVMEEYGGQLQAVAAKLAANQSRVRSDPKIESLIGKRLDDLQLFQATVERD
jgi:cysteinyl-tRNA synthetase